MPTMPSLLWWRVRDGIVAATLLLGLCHWSFAVQNADPQASPSTQSAVTDQAGRDAAVAARRARQTQAMVDSIQIVATAMEEADVEAFLDHVGLVPSSDGRDAGFRESLATAIQAYDRQRSTAVDAPVAELKEAIRRSIGETGYPGEQLAARIPPLRATLAALDANLITAAGAALLPEVDARGDLRVAQAIALRRSDAASQTLGTKVPGLSIAFLSVTGSFVPLESMDPSVREHARGLLLLDGEARADAAERLSFAWLEGGVFLAARTAIDVQLAAKASEDAGGEPIDPMRMMGVALSIQLRGVTAPTQKLATLDEALVRIFASELPTAEAFEIIYQLERSSPGGGGGTPESAIPDLERKALGLPSTSADQAKAIREIALAWKRAELDSYAVRLKDEAAMQAETARRCVTISATDVSSWGLSDPDQEARMQGQLARMHAAAGARRAAESASAKQFEAIVGPEAWAAIAPPRAKGARPRP